MPIIENPSTLEKSIISGDCILAAMTLLIRSFNTNMLVLYTYSIIRQSLLSLHMTKSYVRTATRSTLKVEANLTQILNFKANFHTEFEPFLFLKIYANNGGHFKIVSIKIKN